MKKSFTLILMLLAVFALCSTAKADYTYARLVPSEKTLYIRYNQNANKVLDVDAQANSSYVFHIGDDGDGSGYRKNYASSITKIVIDATVSKKENWSSIKELFHDLPVLDTIIGINNIVLYKNKNVTSFYGLFKNCKKLRYIDGFKQWNTDNITNMEEMFYGCTNLGEIDLTSIGTASVTNMAGMFRGCGNLRVLDLSNFNTAKVTNMTEMFQNCSWLEAIYVGNYWSTSKVSKSNSKDMFLFCNDLINYDANNSNDVDYATVGGNGYLSYEPTVDQGYAFIKDYTLYLCYDKYKTRYSYEVENTGTSYPKWTSASGNKNIKKVVVKSGFIKVQPKSTAYWFYGCSNLESIENAEKISFSKTESTKAMFSGCSKLKSVKLYYYNNPYINNVTNMSYMFSGCTALEEITLPSRTNNNSVDMQYMFNNCQSLTKIPNISDYFVSNANYMFNNCSGLTGAQKISLYTSDCTNMGYMFYGCSNITSLEFCCSLAKVTTTEYMFAGCSKLQKLYLMNTTDKSTALKTTKYMFYNDSQLKRIYVENYDYDLCVDNVSTNNSYMMFAGCTSLVGGKGTKYSASYDGKTYARIDKGSTASLKGYFTPYYATIYKETDGGSNSSNGTYRAEHPCVINTSAKSGYVFKGWTLTGDYSVSTPTVDVTIPALEAAYPITCTAHFAVDFATNNDVKIYFTRNSSSSFGYDNTNLKLGVLFNHKWLTEGTDYTISQSTVKDAGSYKITITGKDAAGFAGEKSSYVYVNKASLTIQADAKEKTYGDPDPEWTYTVSGLKGSDKINSVKLSRYSGENQGSYSISVDTYSVDNAANYSITPKNSKLTINPKLITVTPDALSKTYGDDDPTEFTYTVDGLVGDDKLTGSLSRVAGEDAGEYAYSGNLTNSNYTVSINKDVKYIINPKTVSKPNFVFDSEIYAYTGTEVKPLVTVLDGVTEIPASEYTVSYSNNNVVGIGTVIITDNPGGNYTVSGSAFFEIKDVSETYQVTIYSFGIDTDPVTRTIYVVKNQPINNPALFDIEGYTSLGVYTDAECNNSYSFGTTPINSDISLYAKYQINKHKVVFEVDGVEFNSAEYEYGATIPYQDMTKEGYTFSGWAPKPETMPDYDLTIKGNYTINKLNLVYMIDGEEYSSEQVEYGTALTIKANPSPKPGYTFSGWTPSSLPSTMPDEDITVNGSYIPNKHTITFKVNDETFVVETEFNASTASLLPKKTGYKFVPSATLAATMPDENLVVEGSWQMSVYTLTYKVDGKEHQKYEMHYGDAITLIAAPTKEGHKFSGWSEAPATMPDNDLTITGKFSANQYTITFVIDGETYKTVTMYYGDIIIAPTVATKSGYTFSGWDNVPATMPASDITIKGSYTANNATPVAEIAESEPTKVWAYNRTIYIETAPDTKYTIVDLQGRVITTSTTKSTHDEIQINQSGIMIVIIGNQSFKLVL